MKLLLIPSIDHRYYPDQKEIAMTSQSKLDPFMTLIQKLTATETLVAGVDILCLARVLNQLLLTQLLIARLKAKPAGYVGPGERVFRIGSTRMCCAGS